MNASLIFKWLRVERKVGALDQAAPLQGWDLPEAFATLRRMDRGLQ